MATSRSRESARCLRVWVERSRGWSRTTGCARTTNHRGNLSRATKVEQSLTGARRGEWPERLDFVRVAHSCAIIVERARVEEPKDAYREAYRQAPGHPCVGARVEDGGRPFVRRHLPLLPGPMTAAREQEESRPSTRMGRCLFLDSARHVVPGFLSVWIIVALLNGERAYLLPFHAYLRRFAIRSSIPRRSLLFRYERSCESGGKFARLFATVYTSTSSKGDRLRGLSGHLRFDPLTVPNPP